MLIKRIISSVNRGKIPLIVNFIVNLFLVLSIEPGRNFSSWGTSVWLILLFIQFVWIGFLVTKKSYLLLHILFYNLYFILIFNFLLTPLISKNKTYPSLSKNISVKFKIKDKEMHGFNEDISLLTTDHKGFRVNKKINYKLKDDNVFRIVLIGASQLEEIYVDDKKIWSNLFAKKLESKINKKVEVINTGVSGASVSEHLKTLRYFINLKNTDHFIFLFGQNDWNKYLFKENLNFIDNFFLKFSFRDSLLMNLFTFVNFEMLSKNKSTIKIIHERYGKNQSNSLENRNIIKNNLVEIPDNYKKKVFQILDLCKKNNLECTFIKSFNAYNENIDKNLLKNFWMTPPNVNYSISLNDLIFVSNLFNNWLKEQAIKNKFNFCDINDDLESSIKYFYDDAHLNPNGSKKLSNILFKCFVTDLM